MNIKVVSLNMWSGGKLFPEIIEFLESEDPDIVMLQEVHDGMGPGLEDRHKSMETLKSKLAYPHQDFAKALMLRESEGLLPLGNAVLSKFPIKSRGITVLVDSELDEYRDIPEHWPIEPRILQHVELAAPGGPVNVFNIHGVWDLAGDNPSPERRQMIERTLRAVGGKPNVILAGDTNASRGNPLLKEFEGPLKAVFGPELKSTFNMRHKENPGYATAAVDLMYVSPDVIVKAHECPDVDISDHLPIVAALEIN